MAKKTSFVSATGPQKQLNHRKTTGKQAHQNGKLESLRSGKSRTWTREKNRLCPSPSWEGGHRGKRSVVRKPRRQKSSTRKKVQKKIRRWAKRKARQGKKPNSRHLKNLQNVAGSSEPSDWNTSSRERVGTPGVKFSKAPGKKTGEN